MALEEFWWSSDGGGPDPGDLIGQSLRFRGTQSLTRTVPTSGNRGEFTISVWSKIVPDQIFTYYEQTNGNGFAAFYGHNTNNTMQAVNLSNFAGTNLSTPGLYRDPSAWYHYVVNYSSAGTVIFINGQQAASDTTFTGAVANSNGTFQIGTSNSEGYLADYYFIDGQALLPTAFGRYNNDGVWVPRETNWEDPINAGALIWSDMLFTSGNAATPDLTSTATDFAPGSAAVGAFNGIFASEAAGTVDGGWFIWRPTRPVRIRTSFSIGTRNCTEIWVNGVSTGVTQPATTPTSTNIFPALNIPTGGLLLETLAIRGNPNIAAGEARLNEVNINDLVYVDGTNPDYGTNGFHLTFADPDDIGHDSSGNDNDFTATGFDTVGGDVSWASFGTITGGTYFNNDIWINCFDGDPNTNVVGDIGTTLTWTPIPGTGINVTNDITLRANGQGARVSINGGAAQVMNFNADTTYSFTGTLTSLVFTGVDIGFGPNNPTNNKIEIDGVELIQAGRDYDLMQDSPTQNYPTFNPLWTMGTVQGGQLWDAGLGQSGDAAGASYAGTQCTQSVKGGKYYFEVYPGAITNSFPCIYGVTRNTTAGNPTFAPGTDSANNVPGYGYAGFGLSFNGDIWGSTDGQGGTSGTSLGQSQAFGQGQIMAMLCDVPNNDISWLRDNVAPVTSVVINNIDDDYEWIPTMAGLFNSVQSYVNFGQQPFRFNPPNNYVELQTQNYPEATIPNGRDHFQAITYTGTNVQRDITELEFQPDLVWIKGTDNDTNHVLVDSVRGAEEVLESNESFAQVNDPQSVNAFLANGFSVGTSNDVNNNTPNLNSYVAWCWRAGGAETTINAGSISPGVPAVNSNVSANTDAGFSIVQWSGNGSNNGTVAHGLNAKPELIFYKTTAVANNWNVWYSVGDTNTSLILNSANNGVAINTATFGTPNAQTISNFQTGVGTEMIAYCWHSVPGYSAIGSYSGNQSNNGPFVYTGFRPAWVMIKCTSANSSWEIIDTARDVFNPANQVLQANDVSIENTNLFTIDILSNGFKIRDQGGLNLAQDYIYCCFAENPFGGSNVSPANAR